MSEEHQQLRETVRAGQSSAVRRKESGGVFKAPSEAMRAPSEAMSQQGEPSEAMSQQHWGDSSSTRKRGQTPQKSKKVQDIIAQNLDDDE